MSAQPTCWRCGSTNVTIQFTSYAPTYHKRGECEPECRRGQPCGESATGRLTCHACSNVWDDGAIDEYEAAS